MTPTTERGIHQESENNHSSCKPKSGFHPRSQILGFLQWKSLEVAAAAEREAGKINRPEGEALSAAMMATNGESAQK